MIGLGVLLVILGFGSLILEQMGYEFTVLSWATDMQPTIGIVVGIIGIVVIVAGVVLKNRANASTVVVNNNPPLQQPQQGYAPPQQQGYAAPQQPVQQQYADPNAPREYPQQQPPRA